MNTIVQRCAFAVACLGALGLLLTSVGWSAPRAYKFTMFAPYQVPQAREPRPRGGPSFGSAKYTLLVSLDGVSYDSILRMVRHYPAQVPHLRRLIRRGFLRPVQSTFPSMTWPNHVSLVTGQYPRHHGVLGNRWLEDFFTLMYPYTTDLTEPDRYIRTPALYDLAARRGWRTAALNWPSTQKAKNIYYNLPEIMGTSRLSYRYTSKPLRREILRMWRREFSRSGKAAVKRSELKVLLGRIGAKERIETDMLMRDIAIRLVAPRRGRARVRPRILLLHFVLPDSLLHTYGPHPWVERWGLEQMDRLIGQVIQAYKRAKIWRKTAVFVTSDHGFLRITHSINIRRLFTREGVSRFRSMGRRNRRRERVLSFVNGHAAFLYVKPDYVSKYVPKIMKVLRSPRYRECIEAVLTPDEYSKMGLPLVDKTDSDKLRAGIHAGSPTLIAVSRAHCLFRTSHRSRRIILKHKKYSFGAHGYFPHRRPMWTFLLGSGAGVRARGWRRYQQRRPVYIVDVAPTIAHLMGLRWPRRWEGFGNRNFRLDGRILSDVLKKKLRSRRRKR